MDVDEEGKDDADGAAGDEEEWMDIDEEGEGGRSQKKIRTNTGSAAAVTAKKSKREPRSNRMVAGMRDSTVRYNNELKLLQIFT